MEFKVFQISLDNDVVADINDPNTPTPDIYNRYLKTISRPKPIDIERAYQAGDYDLVAAIDAADLEDVFRIGNIGPEEKITRYAPMRSVSVGDIVFDTQNETFHYVDYIGFEKICLD